MNAFWTVFEIGVNCFQGWMFTWFIYRMLTIRPERTRKQQEADRRFIGADGFSVCRWVDCVSVCGYSCHGFGIVCAAFYVRVVSF